MRLTWPSVAVSACPFVAVVRVFGRIGAQQSFKMSKPQDRNGILRKVAVTLLFGIRPERASVCTRHRPIR